MGKRIFGELELAILSVLKKDGAPRTVRDVLQELGNEDKYTTIMTVMNRLVAKGDLLREREGLSYRYSVKAQRSRFSLFDKYRQKFFGGKSVSMISYLLEEDLGAEELAQIEKLIEQAKQKGKS